MFNRRWLVLGLLLLAAAGLSAVWRLYFHLPAPQQATRQQVLRWLVLRDLRLEPPQVQLALMERLQDELQEGLPAEAVEARVPSKYEAQLRSNADLLTELWFTTRVRQYHELDRRERVAFLKDQIETLLKWSRMRQQLQQESSGGAASRGTSTAGSTAAFFDEIEGWMAEADAVLRLRMSQAVHDGVIVWLATSELDIYDPATQRTLALRLADALRGGQSGSSDPPSLTAEQRQQFADNARLLVKVWFYAQAEAYALLPHEQRAEFIDARIDEVNDADVLTLLGGSQAADAAHTNALSILQLLDIVGSWIDEAPQEERADLRAFTSHIQQRMVWRRFEQLLPARQ